MHYHPSRPVTLPSCYIEMSSSLIRGAMCWSCNGPLLPCWLDGPARGMDWEVFDPVRELGSDKAFFIKGTSFMNALTFYLQEFHLLGNVNEVLVILAVAMDISKETPIIKVIDSVLKNGVEGAVAPEVMTDLGREGFNQFVSGIIGRGV